MNERPASQRRFLAKAAEFATLAITLLVLCLAVQAVHAKTSHYPPASSESRHFSASVKIARVGQPDLATPMLLTVGVACPAIAVPQTFRLSFPAKTVPPQLSRPVSSRLLRSPPQSF
jgi:hypothetical protein